MPHSPPPILYDRPTKIAKMDDSIDMAGALTGTTPIPSYRPDAKTRRYDRQLRLWASAGQKSLEQARVLLVGCDATGCQALKNLVLPGISHFTILSSHSTTSQDIATNFFLHPDSLGASIAEETVKYLKELNPSVDGAACVKNPEELLETNPNFFTSFTLIIASGLDPDPELRLSDLLWEAASSVGGPDIPLIAIRSSGFIGRVEIQLREHCVVDTHPDTTHTLRIDKPFPALEAYARSLNMAEMDSMEFSHVPWVVLLVRAGALWRDKHDGQCPSTDEEKSEFKNALKAEMRKGDEENYEEALGQAYKVWSTSQTPFDLQELLEDESVRNVSQNSKNLHLLLHTLARYLSTSPRLPPTAPTLPDMHSSTASYITLQNLFKSQYQSDLVTFNSLLTVVLQEVGLPEDAISDEEVEGFVRNCAGVAIVKGQPLRERKLVKGVLRDTIKESYDDTTPSLHFGLQLALLASERFFSTHSRWPGAGNEKQAATDNSEISDIVGALIKEALPGFDGELGEDVVDSVAEVVRGGFGTLPTTAAFLGGLVAQEAIKLVTGQYNPLDNTVIVDLVKSGMEKFKF